MACSTVLRNVSAKQRSLPGVEARRRAADVDEFDLINRYFTWAGQRSDDVLVGVGDDAALVRLPPGEATVLSLDTMVEDVHFPGGLDPELIGERLAAVNLSDQAAMGACPAFATLALTLPAIDEAWLGGFARGLRRGLEAHGCRLVGGDTTRGPLTMSLHITGSVAAGGLTRDGACVGDQVFVSGTLGDAAAAIAGFERSGDFALNALFLERFCRPQPRLRLGESLLGIASAAIDISDGLIADLGHVARLSHVGIDIELDSLPRSNALMNTFEPVKSLELAACGGDDYELAFTVAGELCSKVLECAEQCSVPVTRIGVVTDAEGVRCLDSTGEEVEFAFDGYRHFGV